MKIGMICQPVAGHLHPMTTLGRHLRSRGHEVVFLGIPEAAAIVRGAGLAFVPFGEEEFPLDSRAKSFDAIASRQGLDVLRTTIEEVSTRSLGAMLRDLPGKLAEAGIEALVIDTTCFFAELAAMSLDLPYVHVWCVLNVDPTGTTPPSYFGWPPGTTPGARARNLAGLEQIGELARPLVPIAAAFADRVGLAVDCSDPRSFQPPLAVISQTPEAFDFPGIPWPPGFHHAGPFHDDEGREPVPFAWEELDGRPLIYASLGTLVNGQAWVHRAILDALERFPGVQAVFSVGRDVGLGDLGPIPPNTIVVPVAPQIGLLERASLCITHAGLNTTLEALTRGVPLVAIPIAYDQPGVAARIVHHRAGEAVEPGDLTAASLAGLIRKVLVDPSYLDRALGFRDAIAAADGLAVACDLVERAFGVGRPAGNGRPATRREAFQDA